VNHGACLLAAGFSKTWMHESYQPAASRLWGCILYYIALGDPLWLAPTHSHPAHTVLAVHTAGRSWIDFTWRCICLRRALSTRAQLEDELVRDGGRRYGSEHAGCIIYYK
jgi:hypothetical protein